MRLRVLFGDPVDEAANQVQLFAVQRTQLFRHGLFHAITDTMELIEGQEYQKELVRLEQACRDAEEIYISPPKNSKKIQKIS